MSRKSGSDCTTNLRVRPEPGGAASAGRADQFNSGVNAVEVYAAVVDRAGRPITGLQAGDFTVLEDGQPQVVTTFAEGTFPLALAVAVDHSFSMSRELQVALSGARTLLGELRPQDQAAIIGIGSEVETLAPLTSGRDAAVRCSIT